MNKRRWLLINWFSNFDYCRVPVVDEMGIKYHTVERAFQAHKSIDKETRLRFTDMSVTEGDIKKLGRNIQIRPDWDDIKIDVMRKFVVQKYKFNLDHQAELLRSRPYDLVEWNRWHDNFWGVCICDKCTKFGIHGQNHLGHIVMAIRTSIATEEIAK